MQFDNTILSNFAFSCGVCVTTENAPYSQIQLVCSGCSMSEVLDIIDPWLAFLMIVCSSVITLALPRIVDLFSEREHDSF